MVSDLIQETVIFQERIRFAAEISWMLLTSAERMVTLVASVDQCKAIQHRPSLGVVISDHCEPQAIQSDSFVLQKVSVKPRNHPDAKKPLAPKPLDTTNAKSIAAGLMDIAKKQLLMGKQSVRQTLSVVRRDEFGQSSPVSHPDSHNDLTRSKTFSRAVQNLVPLRPEVEEEPEYLEGLRREKLASLEALNSQTASSFRLRQVGVGTFQVKRGVEVSTGKGTGGSEEPKKGLAATKGLFYSSK